MNKEQAQQWIGNQIATLRKKEGLSQAELAERCGLSQNHITRIESGRYNVGFYQIQTILEALNCTMVIIHE